MATMMKNSFYGRSQLRASQDLAEMAGPQMMATVIGGVFLMIGLVGFLVPDLLHAHLSAAHNMVHLISGAIAMGVGLWGTKLAVQMFDFVFGAAYGLLGVAGFVLGVPGAASVGHDAHDSFLWKVIPDVLELGSVDHGIHILVGLAFVIGGCLGFRTQSRSSDRMR